MIWKNSYWLIPPRVDPEGQGQSENTKVGGTNDDFNRILGVEQSQGMLRELKAPKHNDKKWDYRQEDEINPVVTAVTKQTGTLIVFVLINLIQTISPS